MKTALGEVTSKIGSGATPRGGRSAYAADGTAFIRSQNILDLSFEPEGLAYIDDEQAEALKGVSVQPGDVLINITGDSVARATLWQFDVPARVSQHVAIIRPIADRIDGKFLQYYLVNPEMKAELLTMAAGGGSRPALTKGMLNSLRIDVPNLCRQRAIGEVLGALDDKIAANRRVIAASEDLRAHLWKRACASDRSEVPLSSLARFVNGRAFTKDASGTGRVVIRIAELNSGIGASTVRNDIVVADDHLARPGDLLLAWSGSLTAARWYRDEAIVNQHIFKVIPGENFEMWAVASAVESKVADFQEIAKDKATTMGHIRRSDLDQPVGWPVLSPEEIGVGRSLWSRALSAEMENEVLIRARDELLPLLMNGRITVEAAEKTAESVL